MLCRRPASTCATRRLKSTKATDVVIDRDDVHRTSLGGPQWFEEDFDNEDDELEDDELEDEEEEAGDKKAADVGQVLPESSAKKPAEARVISTEEARMQVRGVVQDWLSKKGGQDPAVKPR